MMTRDNDRIIQLLADGQAYLRNLAVEVLKAGDAGYVAASCLNALQSLDNAGREMNDRAVLLGSREMGGPIRSVQVGDRVLKRVEAMHASLHQVFEEIVSQEATTEPSESIAP